MEVSLRRGFHLCLGLLLIKTTLAATPCKAGNDPEMTTPSEGKQIEVLLSGGLAPEFPHTASLVSATGAGGLTPAHAAIGGSRLATTPAGFLKSLQEVRKQGDAASAPVPAVTCLLASGILCLVGLKRKS